MLDWRNILVKQNMTMQDSIKILNDEALQILMVIDDKDKLIGTVTDGDIRRGLMKHLSMDTLISEFMHKTPTTCMVDESHEDVLSKMNSLAIQQIPIVKADMRVVGLETLHHLIQKTQYDNPVFLMAGGFGKRLMPLTEHIPKPLLKVGKKPILETILDQFISVGFHNFYISTHYKADLLREHFGDGSEWGVSIKYVHEEEPLGTAGALGLLPKDLSDLPIIMMNGDILTRVNFDDLLVFHNEHGGDATMCVREYDFQVPYGVIESENHHITSISEKPVHKFFVNAGIYVLDRSILDMVDGKEYLDMPQMLETKINSGGQVNMFPLHEYWLDIGQIEQYEKANQEITTSF